ncbi:MAG: hypothetical protein HC806_04690 [Anaerolineae bacterium]|nr:hypothetical protein [Anaerolineae bacterium]
MKRILRWTILSFTLLSTFLLVPFALAHPLGNFTTNHFAELRVGKEEILLTYVLDMAEIPAFQEISTFDKNDNQVADTSEAAEYHAPKCQEVLGKQDLSLNNRSLSLALVSSEVSFPLGVGNLPTLRLTCSFRGAIPALEESGQLVFRDMLYPNRLGWREIVVIADGISIQGDFTASSISNRLMAYPEDLLESPLDQREVFLTLASGGRAVEAQAQESQTTSFSNQPWTGRRCLYPLDYPTGIYPCDSYHSFARRFLHGRGTCAHSRPWKNGCSSVFGRYTWNI